MTNRIDDEHINHSYYGADIRYRNARSRSRIPSISTGGAATNAKMNTVVAVSNVGIISKPNHPMYKRLFVDVME